MPCKIFLLYYLLLPKYATKSVAKNEKKKILIRKNEDFWYERT